MAKQSRDRDGETYTQKMNREAIIKGLGDLARFCGPGFDVPTLRAGMAQVESLINRYEGEDG
jgi:hypothetical protein